MGDKQNLAEIHMRAWRWSGSEKQAARRAYESALNSELESAVREAKERAAQITSASQLWDLEGWLGKRRRSIDETFDYRYSVLPVVFAGLIRRKKLALEQLEGIAPDKLKFSEQLASFGLRE